MLKCSEANISISNGIQHTECGEYQHTAMKRFTTWGLIRKVRGIDKDSKGRIDKDRKGRIDKDRKGMIDKDRKGRIGKDRKGRINKNRKGGLIRTAREDWKNSGAMLGRCLMLKEYTMNIELQKKEMLTNIRNLVKNL